MNPIDALLMLADGIRAGSVAALGTGTFGMHDHGQSMIDATTLTGEPRVFTATMDLDFVQVLPTEAVPPVDYRALLIAYMAQVLDCESCDYIRSGYQLSETQQVTLLALLPEARKMVGYDDY